MASTPAKVAMTWIDLLMVALLAVLGMGVWHLCASWAYGDLRDQEPTEEEVQEHFKLPRLQRNLTAAEEEWKATLAQIIQQRLEAEKQAEMLRALQGTAPGTLANKKSLETVAARDTAARIAAGLERRLDTLDADLTRRQAVILQARKAASHKWKDKQERFERWQRLSALVRSSLISAGILFGLWALLGRDTLRQSGSLHPTRVLVAATILLAALFGFETLGAPGFAVVISALLIALFMTLLHPSPTGPPS
jgi:hypothetical protein